MFAKIKNNVGPIPLSLIPGGGPMVPTHVSDISWQGRYNILSWMGAYKSGLPRFTRTNPPACANGRNAAVRHLVPRAVFRPVRTRGMHNQAALISFAVKESFSRRQREGKLIASTFRTATSSPTADFKGSTIEFAPHLSTAFQSTSMSDNVEENSDGAVPRVQVSKCPSIQVSKCPSVQGWI